VEEKGGAKVDTTVIDRFDGTKHKFLSNFYMGAPLWYDGIYYPSSEHAYQAAKADNYDLKRTFARMATPNETKQHAKRIKCREGFHQVKSRIMFEIVLRKFISHNKMKEKLLETGDFMLIEGNTWHDNYWGDCVCGRESCNITGENNLGKILMEVRKILKG